MGPGLRPRRTLSPFSVWANTALQLGHGGGGHGHFGLFPIDVELGGESLPEAPALELERCLAGLERAARDLQLVVQLEQIEVRSSHIGHERHEDGAPGLLAGQ
jgi:hypothetical protein